MSEKEVRPDDTSEETPSPQDPVVSALRDIPRLRSIHEEKGSVKPFVPPPPFASRVGGLGQGCSGVLLVLTGLVMLLTAMWFGFYLWGPGLVLTAGLFLIGGTGGVWRGYRMPLIASTAAILALALVSYFWMSYVPVAFRLMPVAGLGLLLGSLWYIVVMVVVVTLIAHGISLFYWKKLKSVRSRAFMFWIAAAFAACIISVVLHVTQQQQRQTWLDDHKDTWTAEAATDQLNIGWTGNVTLGYSFVQSSETDDSGFDARLAELNAALEGGSELVRISASGDLLLETQVPRLFELKDDASDEDKQKAADRLTNQQAAEDEYMARVKESGVKLVLVDAQYSPYLIVQGGENDGDKLTWDEFTQIQENRIRHYAELYQPYAYEVVSEPSGYATYSAVDEGDDVDRVALWVAQTERLIKAVNEVSPDTLIGVTISIDSDFEKDFYAALLENKDLDYLGVRLFQPGAFQVIEDLFKDQGEPREYGKQFWIVETWYGYCLAPQRSMKLDAEWLDLVAAFSAKESITTMLANDYGCFLQPGGTALQTFDKADGRTDVWKRWRDLIQVWKPAF